MKSISSLELRRLRNELPIADVLRTLGIPSMRRGTRTVFRCPACTRLRTVVHQPTNLARCFGCKRNFNPIDLTMAERGTQFLDAVRFLRDHARESEHGTGAQPVRARTEPASAAGENLPLTGTRADPSAPVSVPLERR